MREETDKAITRFQEFHQQDSETHLLWKMETNKKVKILDFWLRKGVWEIKNRLKRKMSL